MCVFVLEITVATCYNFGNNLQICQHEWGKVGVNVLYLAILGVVTGFTPLVFRLRWQWPHLVKCDISCKMEANLFGV